MAFRCSCGVVLRSREGCAHNQEALRHFLDIERARAVRSRARILVALVAVRPAGHRLPAAVAAGIFSGLWKGLREVDVVGWLREERLAGAILAAGSRCPTADDARTIARRLQVTIRACLPGGVADRVRVRVIQLQPDGLLTP